VGYLRSGNAQVTSIAYGQMQVSKVEKARRKFPDPRFESERFRRSVRRVLQDIGQEPTFGNFKRYDKFIDWEQYAKNLEHPTKVALCHVLDGQGRKVCLNGVPVQVAQEIPACSESEAARLLKKQSKVFVRWW
jgi:hypothetical protein